MLDKIKEASYEIQQLLLSIIDTAIAISEADYGNIQLIDPSTHALKIVAHRGFPPYWLEYWDSVAEKQGSCGTALQIKERVIVEDVSQSPLFQGEALEIQLKAGIRAVQSTPMMTRSGKIIGMFSTHYKNPHRLSDHSSRLLDLFVKHAADSIEQIVLKKELAKQEEELKRAITIREEFISMISHELKTPLTSIKIITQLGKRLMDEGKLTENKLHRIIDTWLEQLETFECLIGTMLDITAISRGLLNFSCQQIDFNDILTKIVNRFNDQIIYHGTSIRGYWDPFRFEQILTNLVTNGIKYGNGNALQISLLPYNEKKFKLIVKDHGIGIIPEDRQRIFNKFERINHKDTLGGLGLGLYIVNQIVSAVDGEITLDSELGSGSIFIITLPIHILENNIKYKNYHE